MKAIACLLIFFFSINSTISYAEGVEFSDFFSLAHRTLFSNQIQIPEELGKINKIYQSSGQSFLVQIEDAHGEPDAQKNIEKILTYLKETYGVQTIFLEGGFQGPISPDFLRFFQDESINQKIGEALIEKGEVSGGGKFLLNQNKNVKIFGVENPKLYRNHLFAFRHAYKNKPAADRWLHDYKLNLEQTASKELNPELRKFVKEWMLFQDEKNDLLNHLSVLGQFSNKILKINLHDAKNQLEHPMLVRFFKLKDLERTVNSVQRTDYSELVKKEKIKLIEWLKSNQLNSRFEKNFHEILSFNSVRGTLFTVRSFLEEFYQSAKPKGFAFKDYPNLTKHFAQIILSQELDAELLFQEIKSITEKIIERLLKSDREKKIVNDLKDYLLFKKLSALELTREEWQSLRAERNDITLNTAFQNALQFYQLAEHREQTIFQNLTETLKRNKIKNAAFVMGGFHSENFRQFLRNEKISYVTISPNIKQLDSSNLYLEKMVPRKISAVPPALFDIHPLPVIRKISKRDGKAREEALRSELRNFEGRHGPALRLHRISVALPTYGSPSEPKDTHKWFELASIDARAVPSFNEPMNGGLGQSQSSLNNIHDLDREVGTVPTPNHFSNGKLGQSSRTNEEDSGNVRAELRLPIHEEKQYELNGAIQPSLLMSSNKSIGRAELRFGTGTEPADQIPQLDEIELRSLIGRVKFTSGSHEKNRLINLIKALIAPVVESLLSEYEDDKEWRDRAIHFREQQDYLGRIVDELLDLDLMRTQNFRIAIDDSLLKLIEHVTPIDKDKSRKSVPIKKSLSRVAARLLNFLIKQAGSEENLKNTLERLDQTHDLKWKIFRLYFGLTEDRAAYSFEFIPHVLPDQIRGTQVRELFADAFREILVQLAGSETELKRIMTESENLFPKAIFRNIMGKLESINEEKSGNVRAELRMSELEQQIETGFVKVAQFENKRNELFPKDRALLDIVNSEGDAAKIREAVTKLRDLQYDMVKLSEIIAHMKDSYAAYVIPNRSDLLSGLFPKLLPIFLGSFLYTSLLFFINAARMSFGQYFLIFFIPFFFLMVLPHWLIGPYGREFIISKIVHTSWNRSYERLQNFIASSEQTELDEATDEYFFRSVSFWKTVFSYYAGGIGISILISMLMPVLGIGMPGIFGYLITLGVSALLFVPLAVIVPAFMLLKPYLVMNHAFLEFNRLREHHETGVEFSEKQNAMIAIASVYFKENINSEAPPFKLDTKERFWMRLFPKLYAYGYFGLSGAVILGFGGLMVASLFIVTPANPLIAAFIAIGLLVLSIFIVFLVPITGDFFLDFLRGIKKSLKESEFAFYLNPKLSDEAFWESIQKQAQKLRPKVGFFSRINFDLFRLRDAIRWVVNQKSEKGFKDLYLSVQSVFPTEVADMEKEDAQWKIEAAVFHNTARSELRKTEYIRLLDQDGLIPVAIRYIEFFLRLNERNVKFEDETGLDKIDLRTDDNGEKVYFSPPGKLSRLILAPSIQETDFPVVIEWDLETRNIFSVLIALDSSESQYLKLEISQKKPNRPVEAFDVKRFIFNEVKMGHILLPSGMTSLPKDELILRASIVSGPLSSGRRSELREENTRERSAILDFLDGKSVLSSALNHPLERKIHTTKAGNKNFYFVQVSLSQGGKTKIHTISLRPETIRGHDLVKEKAVVVLEQDPEHGVVANVYWKSDYESKQNLWRKEIGTVIYDPVRKRKAAVDLNRLSLLDFAKGKDKHLKPGRFVIGRIHKSENQYFSDFSQEKDFDGKVFHPRFYIPKEIMDEFNLKVDDSVILRIEKDTNQGIYAALYQETNFHSLWPVPLLTYKTFETKNLSKRTGEPAIEIRNVDLGLLDVILIFNGEKNIEAGRSFEAKPIYIETFSAYQIEFSSRFHNLKEVLLRLPRHKADWIRAELSKTPDLKAIIAVKKHPDYGIYLKVTFQGELIGNYYYLPDEKVVRRVDFDHMRLADWIFDRALPSGNKIQLDEHLSERAVDIRGRLSLFDYANFPSSKPILKINRKKFAGIKPQLKAVRNPFHGYEIRLFDANQPKKDQQPLAVFVRDAKLKQLVEIKGVEERNEIYKIWKETVEIIARIRAKKANRPKDWEILTSGGYEGAYEGEMTWDGRGNKDSFVKQRINQRMLDQMRREGWLSKRQIENLRKINQAAAKLMADGVQLPSIDEISQITQIATKTIKELMGVDGGVLPFSALTKEGVIPVIRAQDSDDLTTEDHDIFNRLMNDYMWDADFSDNDRLLMDEHYRAGVALEHIAPILRVSPSRVSQLHKAIIAKLKAKLSENGYSVRSELRNAYNNVPAVKRIQRMAFLKREAELTIREGISTRTKTARVPDHELIRRFFKNVQAHAPPAEQDAILNTLHIVYSDSNPTQIQEPSLKLLAHAAKLLYSSKSPSELVPAVQMSRRGLLQLFGAAFSLTAIGGSAGLGQFAGWVGENDAAVHFLGDYLRGFSGLFLGDHHYSNEVMSRIQTSALDQDADFHARWGALDLVYGLQRARDRAWKLQVATKLQHSALTVKKWFDAMRERNRNGEAVGDNFLRYDLDYDFLGLDPQSRRIIRSMQIGEARTLSENHHGTLPGVIERLETESRASGEVIKRLVLSMDPRFLEQISRLSPNRSKDFNGQNLYHVYRKLRKGKVAELKRTFQKLSEIERIERRYNREGGWTGISKRDQEVYDQKSKIENDIRKLQDELKHLDEIKKFLESLRIATILPTVGEFALARSELREENNDSELMAKRSELRAEVEKHIRDYTSPAYAEGPLLGNPELIKEIGKRLRRVIPQHSRPEGQQVRVLERTEEQRAWRSQKDQFWYFVDLQENKWYAIRRSRYRKRLTDDYIVFDMSRSKDEGVYIYTEGKFAYRLTLPSVTRNMRQEQILDVNKMRGSTNEILPLMGQLVRRPDLTYYWLGYDNEKSEFTMHEVIADKAGNYQKIVVAKESLHPTASREIADFVAVDSKGQVVSIAESGLHRYSDLARKFANTIEIFHRNNKLSDVLYLYADEISRAGDILRPIGGEEQSVVRKMLDTIEFRESHDSEKWHLPQKIYFEHRFGKVVRIFKLLKEKDRRLQADERIISVPWAGEPTHYHEFAKTLRFMRLQKMRLHSESKKIPTKQSPFKLSNQLVDEIKQRNPELLVFASAAALALDKGIMGLEMLELLIKRMLEGKKILVLTYGPHFDWYLVNAIRTYLSTHPQYQSNPEIAPVVLSNLYLASDYTGYVYGFRDGWPRVLERPAPSDLDSANVSIRKTIVDAMHKVGRELSIGIRNIRSERGSLAIHFSEPMVKWQKRFRFVERLREELKDFNLQINATSSHSVVVSALDRASVIQHVMKDELGLPQNKVLIAASSINTQYEINGRIVTQFPEALLIFTGDQLFMPMETLPKNVSVWPSPARGHEGTFEILKSLPDERSELRKIDLGKNIRMHSEIAGASSLSSMGAKPDLRIISKVAEEAAEKTIGITVRSEFRRMVYDLLFPSLIAEEVSTSILEKSIRESNQNITAVTVLPDGLSESDVALLAKGAFVALRQNTPGHEIIFLSNQNSKEFQKIFFRSFDKIAAEIGISLLDRKSFASRIQIVTASDFSNIRTTLVNRKIVVVTPSDSDIKIDGAHLVIDQLLDGNVLTSIETNESLGLFVIGAFETLLLPPQDQNHFAQKDGSWYAISRQTLGLIQTLIENTLRDRFVLQSA